MPLPTLSRRRRVAAVAAAVLVLAVAVVAGAFALARGGGGEPVAAPPPQDRPGPVLLLPGYGGGSAPLTRLAAALRSAGRDVTVLQPPGGGTNDLREQAAYLDDQVAGKLAGGAESVDVVGFSAGGVVARAWAQEHDGAHKARRIVTLGSPHAGTELAAAGAAFAPGACPQACRQLAPGNDFLAGLRSPVPSRPAWLSLWTEQDEVVTPPESARLDGAVNVALQSLCPGLQVSHARLPADPAVIRIVVAALGAEPLAAPGPGACVRS
jgi:pimeloyl-ACP methyl ester carboxylesterase